MLNRCQYAWPSQTDGLAPTIPGLASKWEPARSGAGAKSRPRLVDSPTPESNWHRPSTQSLAKSGPSQVLGLESPRPLAVGPDSGPTGQQQQQRWPPVRAL